MNKFGMIEVNAKTTAQIKPASEETHGVTTVTLSDAHPLGGVLWRFKFQMSDGREVVVGSYNGGEGVRRAEIELVGDEDAYDLACSLRAVANTLEHQYRTNNWAIVDEDSE
jgi:hypothetical protein